MSGRRTDPEMLIGLCKSTFKHSNWGTEGHIVAVMQSEHGWPPDRTSRALYRALSDFSHEIYVGPGNTIRFAGNDRSLYSPTKENFAKFARKNHIILRHVDVLETAENGNGKGDGVWRHPDLLLLADPGRQRAASDGRRVHAIEIESTTGMDIRSVYQAYEEGRGADYRWVIWKRGKTEVRGLERVIAAAKELGVGLVEMVKPTAPSGWRLHVRATLSNGVTDDMRVDLLERNGCMDARQLLHTHEPCGPGTTRSAAMSEQ